MSGIRMFAAWVALTLIHPRNSAGIVADFEVHLLRGCILVIFRGGHRGFSQENRSESGSQKAFQKSRS